MKNRPKRSNYGYGVLNDIKYEEALERYIDYLLKYYVNRKRKE